MGILSNFALFYDARSTNMVMSRAQDANLENFLFLPNSTFILGKVTKFLVERLSTSEVISQKPHRGGGGGGRGGGAPPVPLGLRKDLI